MDAPRNIHEVAERDRVSTDTVMRWIARGLVTVRDGLIEDNSVTFDATREGYKWTWFSGVYFIRCEGFVKIGYARDVRLRLKSIGTHTPFPIEPLGFIECQDIETAKSLEAALHEKFHHLRERFEWFRLDRSLRDHIASRCDRWPTPKRKMEAN